MIDKQAIQTHFDAIASERSNWFQRNFIYHNQVIQACRPFLDADSRVLELGCSTGNLLKELRPGYGVGIDLSPESIAIAKEHHPDLHFICADVEDLPDDPLLAEPFDLIVMADLVSYIQDAQALLEKLHTLTHSRTRIVISHWNWLWQPLLRLGEGLNLKSPDVDIARNWFSSDTVLNFLELADYEALQTLSHLIFPYQIAGISAFINSFSHAPVLNRVSLLKTVVARPQAPRTEFKHTSVTVVIPTRNEAGNIARAVETCPQMGTHTELLFIDGNSTDGTVEAIQEQIEAHPELDIKLVHQIPPNPSDTAPNLMLKLGKGDAVRKAFDAASGEVLMILDSDLTVPPEDLPKFYDAIASGKGRFINGTRFVYKQHVEAMKPLNMLGNVFFSKAFSWLLSQAVTDTLCGTKVLFKQDYELIKANRSYFGDFDPFGDFDLLFGSARLNLPIIEVPVRYQARTYGESKVRVALHGPLLGRMSLVAFWHFKLRPLLPGQTSPMETVEQEK